MTNKWSKETIIEDASLHQVDYIYLELTDLNGIFRQLEIPAQELGDALDQKLLIDGSSITGFSAVENSDLKIVPDLTTWQIMSVEDGFQLARLICDVYTTDGIPFLGNSRQILKDVLENMEGMGFDRFNVGLEAEFFLLPKDAFGNPILKGNDEGNYMHHAPDSVSHRCRREIAATLERLGFHIEALHHEVAAGQHELSWRYTDALDAADKFQTMKVVTKRIANKYNLHATFMPKPLYNSAGSGMHCNMSLMKDGVNVFYDSAAEDGLSSVAKQFISGILTHSESFTAICNPTVNSYKRLVPGFEAPVYIAWSQKNRSTLLRIPSTQGQATRIELRSADPSANPYLVLAVALSAGLDGIGRELAEIAPINQNIYHMSASERAEADVHELPHTLLDAIRKMKSNDFVLSVLGPHLTTQFIDLKTREYWNYEDHVSQWELEHYLNKY